MACATPLTARKTKSSRVWNVAPITLPGRAPLSAWGPTSVLDRGLHVHQIGAMTGLQRIVRTTFAVVAAVSLYSERAHAQNTPAPTEPLTPRVELRHDLRIDIPVTVGIAGGLITWTLLKNDVLGDECTICEPRQVNAIDDFFRTALRRPDPQPARVLSDVLSYGVGPALTVGLGVAAAAADHRLDESPLDLLLVAQASLTAVAVSEMIKPFALRERPDFHALDPEAKKTVDAASEPLLSFPSGHPMAVWAVTASMGTVASMRGYRLAPMIWIAGSVLGLATGYLRIAADRHYFTDVLAGAAIGYGVGAAIPYLFHRPVNRSSEFGRLLLRTRISTTDVPGGRIVTLGTAF
jgi:membrane-associated phospholipid phosphatase